MQKHKELPDKNMLINLELGVTKQLLILGSAKAKLDASGGKKE